MRSIFILSIMCLSLWGCNTTQKGFYDPDELSVPEVSVPSIPVKNEANVRLPELVKAYPVGRYQDPSDSRIMHERHIMYRKEVDPNWRLSSSTARQILVGPTMTDSPLENQPALLEKELGLAIKKQQSLYNEQKQINEELIAKNEALFEVLNLLNERIKEIEKDKENEKYRQL